MDDQTLRQGLALTLERTDFEGLGQLQRGKVRDCYVWPGSDGSRVRAIVVTDRISAFDHVLGTIPFKGQVLNGLSAFWFAKTADVSPNHLLSVPDPAVTLARECRPYPVELVVRGYLTGTTGTSIWTHYARGERDYCGHRLPDGLRKHERLPAPLVTPTTKGAAGAHDEPVSRADIIARGLASADEFDALSARALAVFARGQALAAERGLILVDTKYELGRDAAGEIVLIDEVHTPDSSRYWYTDTYAAACAAGDDPRALDKEWVRRELVAQGYRGDGAPPPLSEALRLEAARRYVEIYEQMTGRPFIPDLRPPVERIRVALEAAYAAR